MASGASKSEKLAAIKDRIKSYPNFPTEGVVFKDVFTLAHHPSLMPSVSEMFHERLLATYPNKKIDILVGVDSRGFLFGPDLAARLQVDFVPARKIGKLPGKTVSESYTTEYSSATLEIQEEYLKPGHVAVVVDDVMATGGTMSAVCNLLKKAKLEVLECQCIIELPKLKGRSNLPPDCPFFSLIEY